MTHPHLPARQTSRASSDRDSDGASLFLSRHRADRVVSGDSIQRVSGFCADRDIAERELTEHRIALAMPHRADWQRLAGASNTLLLVQRDDHGEPVTACSPSISRSRAMPGHRIYRVERLDAATGSDAVIRELVNASRHDHLSLRVIVETFEPDAAARSELEGRLAKYGFTASESRRRYSQTLALDLAPGVESIFAGLHATARRHIRAIAKRGLELRPITDASLANQLAALSDQAFARTGGSEKTKQWKDIVTLSNAQPATSRVIGVFDPGAPNGADLLAFAWGCAHGSYVSYEAAGSIRRADLTGTPLGYAPMWDLICWARATAGVRWFDFGGIPSEPGEEELAGILRFKRYFSDTVADVGGEWHFEPHAMRGSVARAISGAARVRRGSRPNNQKADNAVGVTRLSGTGAISFKYPPTPGLVSVVIPTYNRASTVVRAVNSALSQTYSSIEVIVVDDGSTDNTRSTLGEFGGRIRYIHQDNAGVPSARNCAMAETKGEFVAFLDSDDEWLDWKIAAQVAALRAHPDAGITWTDMTAVDSAGGVVHERHLRTMYGAYDQVDFQSITSDVGTVGSIVGTGASVPASVADARLRLGNLSNHILIGNLLHTPTVLVRRSWIEQAGGFDPACGNGGEDYEYYTRLCKLGAVLLLDAPSIRYRIGAEDQLTAPDRMLHMAHRNLMTLRARLAEPGSAQGLSRDVVRRRLASSLGWVGETEFEVGNRGAAARHLGASLRARPALDRRALLLALCCVPAGFLEGLRGLKRRVSTLRRSG